MYKIVDKWENVIASFDNKIDALYELVMLKLKDPYDSKGYHLQ